MLALARLKLRGVCIKCNNCGNHLELKTIGYIKTAKGTRMFECRRCHSNRTRHTKQKKLGGAWLAIA